MSNQENQIYWPRVIPEIAPGLLNYFKASFSNQLADEMVQEVFLRLVQKVQKGEFNVNKGTLRMYAYGIARIIRLEGRRRELLHPVSSVELESIVEEKDTFPNAEAEQLRWAIKKLKPVEQEIILLLLDQDLNLQEISDVLEVPLGTIKSHTHRAKSSLKMILSREELNIKNQ